MAVNTLRTLYFSALTVSLIVFTLFWSAVAVRAGSLPLQPAAKRDGSVRQAPFELPRQGHSFPIVQKPQG